MSRGSASGTLKQGPRSGGTAFNFFIIMPEAHRRLRPARSNITQRCPRCGCVNPRARASHSAREERHGHRRRARKSGETIEAPLVASSAPPRATLQPLAIELYPDFARAVGNIKARGVVARGTLTVEQPPRTRPSASPPRSTIWSGAYDDVKYGKDSTAPYVEVQRTNGRVEVHVQFVPPGTQSGLADRVAQILKVRPTRWRCSRPEGEASTTES